jgi:hypothetical protein
MSIGELPLLYRYSWLPTVVSLSFRYYSFFFFLKTWQEMPVSGIILSIVCVNS